MKKLVFVVLGLYCLIGVTTAAFTTPYSLSGHVYDDIGNPLVGANITFTNMNSSEVIYADSTSGGEYQQDAANFASGYYDGDIISYYATYSGHSNTTNATINVSEGGTLLDLYITLPPAPHLENNTNYYISYYYTVGVETTWSKMKDGIGKIGESTISMVGVAILILILFAAVGWIIKPYLFEEEKE